MSNYPHQNRSGGKTSGAGAPPSSQPTSAPYGAPPAPQSYASAPYGAPPASQSYASTPYGAPPAPQSYGSSPYGAPPASQSYGSSPYGGAPPTSQSYGSSPYGAPPNPQSYASAPPYGAPPPGHPSAGQSSPYSSPAPSAPPGAPSQSYGGYPAPPPSASYGTPFATLVPSSFPPGTDPNVIACFQIADQDGSGVIDDKELQRALSSYNQSFSLRTVHLLMYLFTNSNARKIGPKEFTQVFYSLQNWRAIFERFDRDRSGKIEPSELRDSLYSLGFSISPAILDLLVAKFDKSGGKNNAIEYDNFIECCLTVKGLTEKFKEKDTSFSGSATFTYESFMLTVLPFLIA